MCRFHIPPAMLVPVHLNPHRPSASYLGTLPDDVLDFVRLVAQLFVAKGVHSGREGFILKKGLFLETLLLEGVVVLAAETEGFAQGPFTIPSLSLPD